MGGIMNKRFEIAREPSEDEVYEIECPICGRDSPLVGVNEENEAFHRCPKHGLFLIAWDGAIYLIRGDEVIEIE